MTATYSELPNKLISAANGIDYAYREAGQGTVPLVLLQHFRGNLDNWDPALIDALASTRRVVTFDNAGVGGSTGATPNVVEQMAHDAIAFLTRVSQFLGGGLLRCCRSARAWQRPGAMGRVWSLAQRQTGRLGKGGDQDLSTRRGLLLPGRPQ